MPASTRGSGKYGRSASSDKLEALALEPLGVERDVPGVERAAGEVRQLVVLALRDRAALRVASCSRNARTSSTDEAILVASEYSA